MSVEVLGGDRASILLHDPALGSLVTAGLCVVPTARNGHEWCLDRLPLAKGGPIVEVFQTGATCWTGQTDAGIDAALGAQQGPEIRSTIIVPVQVGGQRQGVFMAQSAWPNRFSQQGLHFCEAIGRWLGMVVQRGELARQVARETEEQRRRTAAENLINVLAHDLRTPLTPLQAHLEMIRKRAAQGADRQDILRHVVEAARALARLNSLITDLMDAGRLDQDLFSLELRPLDLMAVVDETVDLLRLPYAGIHMQGPGNLWVEGDPRRLRQALENLLNNALEHSPSGAPVAVEVTTEVRAEEEWAVLIVRDQGPGIAPGLLPTLFDRFARGPDSTGLGLGLYLARGIVEAHGGALTCESEVGKGTSFQLTLPLPANQH